MCFFEAALRLAICSLLLHLLLMLRSLWRGGGLQAAIPVFFLNPSALNPPLASNPKGVFPSQASLP